ATERGWHGGAVYGVIRGEEVVHLNCDILDFVEGRSRRYQPENRGFRDDCSFLQEEIIGCLGLDLSGASAARECPELAVWIARGEEKNGRPQRGCEACA